MLATLLHDTVFGDNPLAAWAIIIAFIFVLIAAVIVIGVWVARLIQRRGGKR
jgi:hypothetical protein